LVDSIGELASLDGWQTEYLWEDRWWNLADTTSGAGGIWKSAGVPASRGKLREIAHRFVAAEAAIQVASPRCWCFLDELLRDPARGNEWENGPPLDDESRGATDRAVGAIGVYCERAVVQVNEYTFAIKAAFFGRFSCVWHCCQVATRGCMPRAFTAGSI